MKWWKKLLRLRFLLNRIGHIRYRLDPHIKAIRKGGIESKMVKKNIYRFRRIYIRVRTYYVLRGVFMFLLYASAISAVAGNIFLLSDVGDAVVRVSGVIGATVWLVFVLIFNKLIDLETADAYILASEIIAVSPLSDTPNVSDGSGKESKK